MYVIDFPKSYCFRFWMVLHFFLLGASAQALTFDLNVFYLSDTLAASTDSSYKRTIYDGAIMLNLTKKGDVVMGWSYLKASATEETTTTTEYSSTEMGPRIGFYIDKAYLWGLFFTYNLIATATYNSGTEEEWRGTSMKGELAFLPTWGEGFQAGFKINYHKASYTEKVTTTTLTEVDRGRTMIYPSFAMTYRFD